MGDWTALHLFSGAGGGALGFERAGFRTVGAFDVDEEACADFDLLCEGEATQADLSEMLPSELRAATDERPDAVFTSPPCKSFSGCLPASKAETSEYRELSSLAQRGIFLVLEAWSDEPPPLIVMENVPRIQTRGSEWLEETVGMLRSYGYAVSETTHDCGELGGLAQHRRRYLLVARQTEQVPEYLYEPPKQRVRSTGEVLGDLPVPAPGCDAGGPMHHLSRLSALNWVRLSLIPAGGDWRDLPDEIGICDGYRGRYGVVHPTSPSPVVRGAHEARLAPASWADPRINSSRRSTCYGVTGWNACSSTVTGHAELSNGPWSVADPRVSTRNGRHNGGYGTNAWTRPAHTVTAEGSVQNTWASVADPRVNAQIDDDKSRREGSLGVTRWDGPAATVIGSLRIHNWPAATADPRAVEPTHFVLDENGRPVIYGPELDLDSRQSADPVPVIVARDGTWHRPMTTLELAALQGFPTQIDGDWLELAGRSHKRWRERIGNAVPPPAAEAIAQTCAETLEAAKDDGFYMRGEPVWVDRDRPEVTS
ncbi:MAG: DNA cytosine methyltransferase [Bradymonadaceae bacterium]